MYQWKKRTQPHTNKQLQREINSYNINPGRNKLPQTERNRLSQDKHPGRNKLPQGNTLKKNKFAQ